MQISIKSIVCNVHGQTHVCQGRRVSMLLAVSVLNVIEFCEL